MPPPSDVIAELSQRIRQMERSHRPREQAPEVNRRGTSPLELGHLRGCLVEWLSDGRGSGGVGLALMTARSAVREGLWIIVDPRRQWHPPGLIAAGLDLDRVVLVRPARGNDVLWAVEQALQTRGIGAVVCEIDRLAPAAFRRLQLAAEAGGGLGVLLRPEQARNQPSWAERRYLVRPLPSEGDARPPTFRRRVQVELLYARKHFPRDTVVVEIDDAGDRLRVASELGDSAAHLSGPHFGERGHSGS